MELPASLTRDAFTAHSGEHGWTRQQIPQVVAHLSKNGLAILGGEVWQVTGNTGSWNGLIPQRAGPPAVFHWETTRDRGDSWPTFVSRCASDTLAAVAKWPVATDLPPDLSGQLLYNLTWVTEAEYAAPRRGAV
jgi:hypothetical protein